jgi:hypothetical protein
MIEVMDEHTMPRTAFIWTGPLCDIKSALVGPER